MGAVISIDGTADGIGDNPLLKRLVSPECISDNDPYWNKLFSFNFNIHQESRRAQQEFIATVDPLLQSIIYNSSASRNLSTLIRVFLRRSGELEESVNCGNKIFLWQAGNSLLIIRYISVFLAQRLGPSELMKAFEKGQSSNGEQGAELSLAEEFSAAAAAATEGVNGNGQAEEFLQTLVDIICTLPVNEHTLPIHEESIRVVLALLSAQMYDEAVSESSSIFLQRLMGMRTGANALVGALMDHFLRHTEGDPGRKRLRDSKSESLVIALASSMWSALQRTVLIGDGDSKGAAGTMGEVAADGVDGEGEAEPDEFPPQTLASLSNALLMLLACYPSFDDKPNPYRDVLTLFQNSQEVSSLSNLEGASKIDFTALYNRLCASVHERLPMMLLYMLLHKNTGFRNFILTRINLEQLVVPVIRSLYGGVCGQGSSAATFRSHSHQTYLSLIVMLILSEDSFFGKLVHETSLRNVDWYQPDRPAIGEISLGGMIVLVFVKIIHNNIVKTRDRYLHTNSLAALANMSSSFKDLSPLVCQKLIGLLEIMTKRHSKLIQMMRDNAEASENAERAEGQSDGEQQGDSLHKDITALEEGIRTVLEIVNACLCHNLRSNADLIYSILYKRELFELYHSHPMFHDLVWNIYMVINHFSSKVGATSSSSSPAKSTEGKSAGKNEGSNGSHSPSSVHAVLDSIKRAAIEWPTDRLKRFPDLRFKYIEDENSLDFFVPYVWRMIHLSCGLYFDSQSVRLFSSGGANK